MPTRDRHRFAPRTLALPPAPRQPELRERWRSLPFEEQRRLARLALSPDAEVTEDDRRIVRAVARRRLETRWRLYVGAAAVNPWPSLALACLSPEELTTQAD